MHRNLSYAFRFLAIAGLSLLSYQLKAISVMPSPGTVNFVSGQLTASTGLPPPGVTNTSNVSPPQSTGTATETDGNATSTTNGIFSTSGFSFGFTQTFPDFDYTAGTGEATFMAGSGTLYMITDPKPSFTDNTPPDTDYSVDTSLYDMTTETYLYDTVKGGSLTGELTSGNEYEFSANAWMQTQTDPTLTYTPSLAFTAVSTAPENPAPMIPVLLGGLALLRGRLRRFASSPAR